MLAVPPPKLSQDGAPPPGFSATKPITIECGPVLFPDGRQLTIERATAFGFRLFRDTGTDLQIWDEAAKSWVPGAQRPDAQALFFQDGLWRGLLVAVGQNDTAGNKKLETGSAGTPRYWLTCAFAGKNAAGVEDRGESPPSPPFVVAPPGAENLAGLKMDTESPAEATELRMFLADAPSHEIGRVRISRGGTAAAVELVAAGATVVVKADGSIELVPVSGKQVKVTGDLTVTGTVSTSHNAVL